MLFFRARRCVITYLKYRGISILLYSYYRVAKCLSGLTLAQGLFRVLVHCNVLVHCARVWLKGGTHYEKVVNRWGYFIDHKILT